jgi:hypothetical protein
MQGLGYEFYSFGKEHMMLKQEAKAVLDATKKKLEGSPAKVSRNSISHKLEAPAF